MTTLVRLERDRLTQDQIVRKLRSLVRSEKNEVYSHPKEYLYVPQAIVSSFKWTT